MRIVVLVGLPGSGKSTYVEKLGAPVLSSDAVRGLLADSVRLEAMAAASRSLGRPQATEHVVDEIERLLERHAR